MFGSRDLKVIVLVLFIGSFIGTLFGDLIAFALHEGVVKQFFLMGVHLDLTGLAGIESGVIVLNLIVLTLTFGLIINLNFIGLVGISTAYYFLRYFKVD